jgi:hypothetical protein
MLLLALLAPRQLQLLLQLQFCKQRPLLFPPAQVATGLVSLPLLTLLLLLLLLVLLLVAAPQCPLPPWQQCGTTAPAALRATLAVQPPMAALHGV